MEIEIVNYAGQKFTPGIKFFEEGMLPHGRNAFVAVHDEKIVGILSYVDHSFSFPDFLGVAAISVHPDYRGNGISVMLLRAIFKKIKEDKYPGIRFSEYEKMGELYLRPKVRQFAAEAKIRLIEGFAEFLG